MTHLLTARLLLALMLLTFLSPGFGWEMVVDHAQTAQAAAPAATATAAGEHTAGIPGHSHAHEDAHSMLGHVLSHMPASLRTADLPPPRPYKAVMQAIVPSLRIPASPPDELLRPPQTLSA